MFVTEHPAPYWDEAFVHLSEYCDLRVVYVQRFVKSKPWKNYNFFNGIFYNETLKLISCLFSANHVIVGGYYRKELVYILIMAILFFKKISLFSDVQHNKHRNVFKRFLRKILFSRYSYFFISGEKGIEFFKKTYKIPSRKLIYLPYAYTHPSTIDLEQNNSFSKLSILISSRFVERKGHMTLVRALEKCSKSTLNTCHFTFIGEGKLKKEVDYKLSCVEGLSYEMLGWVNIDSYKKQITKNNVLIHPSIFEPFGIPVIDAMNRGLIVIASSGVMSAYDFIKDGVNGYIYNNSSFIDLTKKIEYIAKNKNKLKEISKKARNTIPRYKYFIKKAVEKL